MKHLTTSGRRLDPGINSRMVAMTFMFLTAVAVSFSGLIVRNIEAANPWQINLYRNIAFLVIISMIFLGRYGYRSKSLVAHFNTATIVAAVCLGTAGVAIVQAYTHTTVANTVFFISATPLITLGLAYFILSERLSRSSAVAMIVAVVGLLLTVIGGLGAGNSYGNLMALLTALGLSGFAVTVRANSQREMLPALALAGIIVIVVSLIATADDLTITTKDLALCVVWGAVLSGAAHWVFILAASQLSAGELTLFTLFETALAPLWVWLFLSETPGTLVVVGGVIVLVAVGGRVLLEPRISSQSK